jgi:hypothetical protein
MLEVSRDVEQLGRRTAGQSKYNRLYMLSGKLTLAAMHLRQVRDVGRTYAAALAHVSPAVMPPASAKPNLGAPPDGTLALVNAV